MPSTNVYGECLAGYVEVGRVGVAMLNGGRGEHPAYEKRTLQRGGPEVRAD